MRHFIGYLLIALVLAQKARPIFSHDYNVQFYLYTKLNPKVPQKLETNNNLLLDKSNFNPENKIKVIVHGYLENVNDTVDSSQVILKGYLCNQADVNLILVSYDSKEIENFVLDYLLLYLERFAHETAKEINEFLTYLKKVKPDVRNSKIDVIGHSLGGQIAGFMGQMQPKKDKFNSLTALDPAAPLYSLNPSSLKINKDDAIYVEVIHTSKTFGLYETSGHSDIYVNYGDSQPHCKGITDVLCNHAYSFEIFSEATCNKQEFSAVPCSTANILIQKCNSKSEDSMPIGDEPLTVKIGSYYLKTNYKPPYKREPLPLITLKDNEYILSAKDISDFSPQDSIAKYLKNKINKE